MSPSEADKLLRKYYSEHTPAFRYLYQHSLAVADYAVRIAERNASMVPDINFVHAAAILHDIAIFMTHAPAIGCYGRYPYLAHGYLGRRLLEYEGFPAHALVCERHVGVGITKEEVESRGLPLPKRDMIPVTVEEQIVCYADKFFSKNPGRISLAKDPGEIIQKLSQHGEGKAEVFKGFMNKFGII